MKAALAVFLVLLLLSFAFVCLDIFVWLPEPKLPRQNLRVKGQVQDLAYMVVAGSENIEIQTLVAGRGEAFRVDGKQIYSAFLAHTNTILRRVDTNWEKLQCFDDAWGSPYWFLFSVHTNADKTAVWHLKVRSMGINKIDESGQGDDITSKEVILQ